MNLKSLILSDYEFFTKNNPKKIIMRAGFIPIKNIEDFIGLKTNPLIVIPEKSLGEFVAETGEFKRNPYAFRPSISQYYFYHRMIDVKILPIYHDDLKDNRVMVIERDRDYNINFNDFKIFINTL